MMENAYFAGLKRLDSNFNGLIGSNPLFSGGGFQNATTGLGTFCRDRVMAGQYIDPIRIADPEISALYNGNDLAARIIELRPKECFRRGYQLVLPDPAAKSNKQPENAETAASLEEYAAGLRANELLCDGFVWGRAYGGTLTIVGADDGLDVSLPLDESRIRSIKYLTNVDRRWLFARTYYSSPFHPKYGEVETYQVTNPFGDQQNSVVHETRVLRWDGSPVDILKKRQLAGWTLSVLQRPYDTLRQFDTSFQAISNMLVNASQYVFKLNGVMEMIAAGESSTLMSRMRMVDVTRSTASALVLDRENEDFQSIPTSFGGIAEMLNVMMQRMASAAEMPVSILFGREPAGLNATGEADFQHFYDTVRSCQTHDVGPKLKRLYELICLADDGPTGGKLPEHGLEIQWHSLTEPTDMEKAALYAQMATADASYVTNQILLPEEVALSRFRGGKLRLETEIDVEARERSMAAELDFRAQAAEAKQEAGPDQKIPLTAGESANTTLSNPGMQGTKNDPQSGRKP